ncbi:MAG: hypothetical protein ABIG44_00875 [Planctomycetota bacterium]
MRHARAIIIRTMEDFSSLALPLSLVLTDRLGDMNCDGAVNSYDIDGFICAVSPQCDYESTYPDCLSLACLGKTRWMCGSLRLTIATTTG